MKSVILFLSATLLLFNAHAATNIAGPYVSGHWTVSGSPYLIFSDIEINSGNILTIDPGVDVVFQGYFHFIVNGSLFSVGTSIRPITYRINDTTGWHDTAIASGGGWAFLEVRESVSPADSVSFQFCNVSDMKGGGVWFADRNILIKNCNFTHNNGWVLSFRISDTAKSAEISSCNFYANISNSGIVKAGSKGVTNINDCNIYDNVSRLSTMYLALGKYIIYNNDIHDNQQTAPSSQGTVTFMSCNSAIVSNNKIHHNTSNYIGAINCEHSNVDIVGNIICNNVSLEGDSAGSVCTVLQGGGAIRIISEGDTRPGYLYKIRNNIITNNRAGYEGGALYVVEANVDVFNNTIVNNSANCSGGAFSFFNTLSQGRSKINVKNNIIYNNAGRLASIPNKKDFVIHDLDTLQLENNWMEQSVLTSIDGSFSSMKGDTLTNLLDIIPRFVNPTLTNSASESAIIADFSLLSTSNCIDKGDTIGTNSTPFDYNGSVRISGAKIDMGAIEFLHPVVFVTESNRIGKQGSLFAYPNPAVNLLFVSLPAAKGNVRLTDVTGKIIEEKKVSSVLTSFNVQSLPRGLYFAVWSEDTEASQKVVLQ